MKHVAPSLCRSSWFLAVMLGLGMGWAMTEATNLGVGIAIGGGMAFVMMQRSRGD